MQYSQYKNVLILANPGYFFDTQPNYTYIGTICNLWRNFDDIDDSWESVSSIIDYYGDNQDILIPAAGPGHWNDPDMVLKLLKLPV